MRLSRILILCLIAGGALTSCGPTVHQLLIMDTATYTQCDHADVQVDCVDPDCSNVRGGPWMATACGTRYRCQRVGDNLTCVPLRGSTGPGVMPAVP